MGPGGTRGTCSPSIPALILASLLVARDGLSPQQGGRGAPLRRALAVLALAIVLAVEHSWIRDLNVLRFGEGERIYPDACRWAESQVPPGSLVISMQMSGALKYYTNLTPVRWDGIQPEQVPQLRERARAEGYEWFASAGPFRKRRAQKAPALGLDEDGDSVRTHAVAARFEPLTARNVAPRYFRSVGSLGETAGGGAGAPRSR